MERLNLVREYIETDNLYDKESKKWYMTGVAIKMNWKNGNGRSYPDKPMMEQLDLYIEENMDGGRCVGELKHPKDKSDQLEIDPERISHRFTELVREGNDIHQKAVIIEGNKCGDVVINLMKNGVTLGLSSRALASLEKKKNYIETNCRKIITPGDIVWNPSAGNDAFIEGVLENKEWIYENGVIVESKNFEFVVDNAKSEFKKMTSKTKDIVLEKVIGDYLAELLRNI